MSIYAQLNNGASPEVLDWPKNKQGFPVVEGVPALWVTVPIYGGVVDEVFLSKTVQEAEAREKEVLAGHFDQEQDQVFSFLTKIGLK